MAQCIAPTEIKNPHYGIRGTYYMAVPCGKCPNCLADRRADWSLRLQIELKNSTSAHFITLTYNDENLYYNENGVPSINKKHMQDYMKRLRKTTSEKLRYYTVGEYGTKHKRPHYHILLFNYPPNISDNIISTWSNKQASIGHVKVGTVTHASIHYVTKYHVNKTTFPELANPSFVLMSRKPGIGHQYVEQFREYHKDKTSRAHYTDFGGQKRRLPRYLKEKLYTRPQRLLMNIENDKRLEQDENENMEHHDIANPCKNYYEYTEEKKLQTIRQFKEKINKNDTF